MIAYASALKKTKIAKRTELEKKICKLEEHHKQNITVDNLTLLTEARRELDELLTDQVERILRFLKQSFYEFGSRASKLFAFQLRKKGA